MDHHVDGDCCFLLFMECQRADNAERLAGLEKYRILVSKSVEVKIFFYNIGKYTLKIVPMPSLLSISIFPL